MAARDGMANLILRFRSMCNVGTADYTVSGVAYYTDNHLQDRLDRHRTNLNLVPLRAEPEYNGGTALYHDYYAPLGNLEEAASGTAVWQVEDSIGDDAGTANYTADYNTGYVRFHSDQAGTAYYLRARSFNLERAAAEVWQEQAGFVALHYDVAMDDQRLNRSQKHKMCLDMAHYYRRQAGGRMVIMKRGDTA